MDELKTFVSKTRASASTLLTHMSSLFDTNKAENPKMRRDDSLIVEDGHLSVIAACTPETFEEVWHSEFSNIGLDFRFFLVPGETSKDVFEAANMRSATLFPEEILNEQKAKVLQIYDWVNDIESGPKAVDKKLISFSDKAWKLYTGWRQHLATVGQFNRIDNIACRISMLIAISMQKHEIDEDIMTLAIEIMNWQQKVKKELIKPKSENVSALFENRILAILKKGPQTEGRLRNRLERYIKKHGIGAFTRAITILTKSKVINFNRSLGRYGKFVRLE
jgi:hypothetical protein